MEWPLLLDAESDVCVHWLQTAIGNHLEMRDPWLYGPRDDRLNLWRGNTHCLVISYWGDEEGKETTPEGDWGRDRTGNQGDCQDLGQQPAAPRQGSASSVYTGDRNHLTPVEIPSCRLLMSFTCELGLKWERLPCRTL